MKKFIKVLFVFLLPIQFYVLLILVFKNDFFEINFINYNRSFDSTVKLKNEKNKPTSFILGNSRSLAVTCEDWIEYLPSNEIPFHFDGSRENIHQIRKKIEYLIKSDYDVEKILAVVDYETLNNFKNEGHIYQLHPDVSGDKILFHLNEVKPFFNIKFISSVVYYFLTEKHLGFMRSYIVKNKPFKNGSFNDLFFLNEFDIARDSLGYYSRPAIKKMFKLKRYSKLKDHNRLKFELTKIKEIIDKNKIDFKLLIVSPYKLNELGEDYLILVNTIFDHNEVYDFSGSDYKYEQGNFHESSHFRRKIGQYFLKYIYE